MSVGHPSGSLFAILNNCKDCWRPLQSTDICPHSFMSAFSADKELDPTTLSPATAGQLELHDLQGSFQPKPFLVFLLNNSVTDDGEMIHWTTLQKKKVN